MSYEFFIAQRYFKGDRRLSFWLYTLIISLMIIFFPVTLWTLFWVCLVEPPFSRLCKSAPWPFVILLVILRVVIIANVVSLVFIFISSLVSLFTALARGLYPNLDDLLLISVSGIFGILFAIFRPVISQVGKGQRHVFASIISFLSTLGICIGVAALIITLSVMNGFESEVRSRFIGFDAHLRLQSFHNQGIKDYQTLLSRVEKEKHVLGASPYIVDKAMIKIGKNVEGLILKGTDQVRITQVSDLGKNMIYGELDFSEKADTNKQMLPGIVIGRYLADRLEAYDLGQKVLLISPQGVNFPFTMPRVKQFRLAGIFESGMYEFDNTFAFISIAAAQQLMKMDDEISGIELKLDDMDMANQVAHSLNEKLGYPYYTMTWFELHRNLFSWMKLEKLAMFVILSLIIMVAAFNIISSLIMVVMEKTKEIGILKSMGATTAGIMRIFMFEGLVIGIGGTAAGSFLGYFVCWAQLRYKFFSLPSDIYFIDFLPIRMAPLDFVWIALAAIGLSFVATLYPALKAAKLDPVTAIRYE